MNQLSRNDPVPGLTNSVVVIEGRRNRKVDRNTVLKEQCVYYDTWGCALRTGKDC